MSLRPVRQRAAHLSWAATADRAARAQKGQRGLLASFERQAREMHPEASDDVIAECADSLRKAHFADLNARSQAARQRAS
jgi:hypothetical protein